MGIAGSLNPIFRATKFRRIWKEYLENLNESSVSIEDKYKNPNVMASTGTVIDDSSKTFVKLGRDSSYSNYGETPTPEHQSGIIFVDPDLKLLKALNHERDSLFLAGLQFCPTDDVKIIKDNSGNIKGAMAISYSNMNQIMSIRYIDVDKDSENFKKSISRLLTRQTSSLSFSESVELIRDSIRSDLIKD